jgi:virginiamycin B lyase
MRSRIYRKAFTDGCASLCKLLFGAALLLTAENAEAGGITYSKHTTTIKGFKVTIFSKPTDNSGGSIRIIRGPGKTLWFPENGLGTLVSFTLGGVATAFTVPITGASVHALALGPQNTVWFTDFNSDHVGKVTTTGTFKLYATSDSQTLSNQMVLGSDGRFYFATDNDGIGRTTATGRTSFIKLSNSSYQATAITNGPAGEVWFAEWNGPNVGYVTTTSPATEKEFNAGFGSNSNTFGIAYGSDGRIWFCDPQNLRIGAIHTNGTGLTFYSTGLTGPADSIVAGPDGKLCFGEFSNAVGRITTAGAITEIPLPTSEGTFPVLGITVGPDKNIWFTNNAHAQVGRLLLTVVAAK